MAQPTLKGGPAIVQFGGYSYYFEDEFNEDIQRETWKVNTGMHGPIDERLLSQMTVIGGTPVGALDTPAKYLPYGVGNIGQMVFADTALVVLRKDGSKETWGSGAITASPQITASPTKSFFTGPIQFTGLGKSTKAQTDADYFQALATQAFNDTTFDETKLQSLRWTAALGALSAPFNAIESEDGFVIENAYEFDFKKAANWGAINAMLVGWTARCRFKPVNVGDVDAYLATLLELQGANAILPGDSLSKNARDLVITSGAHTLTLASVGATKGQKRYGLKPLRHGEIEFVAKRTWTSGVANAPFTWAIA